MALLEVGVARRRLRVVPGAVRGRPHGRRGRGRRHHRRQRRRQVDAAEGHQPAWSRVRGGDIAVRRPVARRHARAPARRRRHLAWCPRAGASSPASRSTRTCVIGGYRKPAGPWTKQRVYAAFPLLERIASRSAARLSGGEQQALAIGRALMANPRLLLLDEVSLGLAPVVVHQLYDALPSVRPGRHDAAAGRAGHQPGPGGGRPRVLPARGAHRPGGDARASSSRERITPPTSASAPRRRVTGPARRSHRDLRERPRAGHPARRAVRAARHGALAHLRGDAAREPGPRRPRRARRLLLRVGERRPRLEPAGVPRRRAARGLRAGLRARQGHASTASSVSIPPTRSWPRSASPSSSRTCSSSATSANQRRLDVGAIEQKSIRISDDIAIGWMPLITFLVAVGVLVALSLFLHRTQTGRAFRATSDDTEAARLMGIDNKRIYASALGISVATAALAGVFLGIKTQFDPSSGPDPADLRLRGRDHRRSRLAVGHAGRRHHPRGGPDGGRAVRHGLGRADREHGVPRGAGAAPDRLLRQGGRRDVRRRSPPSSDARAFRVQRATATSRVFSVVAVAVGGRAGAAAAVGRRLAEAEDGGAVRVRRAGPDVEPAGRLQPAWCPSASRRSSASAPTGSSTSPTTRTRTSTSRSSRRCWRPWSISVPVALLAFRLRGGYFAIGTWVIAEVIAGLVAKWGEVGAGRGVSLDVAGYDVGRTSRHGLLAGAGAGRRLGPAGLRRAAVPARAGAAGHPRQRERRPRPRRQRLLVALRRLRAGRALDRVRRGRLLPPEPEGAADRRLLGAARGRRRSSSSW